MHQPEIHIHPDKQRVAEAFALFLAYWLKTRERATVALSGGSTPRLLFRHLADLYRDRIDWSKVHFFWGDERCVPPGHADSNFGMTRDLLLQHIAIPEKNIHRIRGEADPEAEARRYGEDIRKFVAEANGRPAFDLVLLGMGDDGHTASIFPGQMELLTSNDTCAVARHPESGQQRITLTGPVINNAGLVAFLVTGAGKRERVADILQRREDWKAYPAAHIRPERGELHWFLDEEAGGGTAELGK